MDTVNRFALSVFAKNCRFSNNFEALTRRFQTLSLVYITLLSMVLAFIFTVLAKVVLLIPQYYLVSVFSFPLLFINLYLISKQKLDTAAVTLILIFHFTNKVVADYLNCPLFGMMGFLLYPYLVSFITSSFKVILLNLTLCFVQLSYDASVVYQIFDITINEEQSRQILSLIWGFFYVFIHISLISVIQKIVDTNIGRVTQANFERSEKLNKEVIEAMEAKDTFVSMVSHEIRNPLNSLKGSVDYLVQVVKDQEHLKILRSANLSGEILLNLVNNVLDAAKLRSNKIEIACVETDFVRLINKLLMINAEALREKEIFAQAYIDESLPRLLMIDPSRMLQVLMNLVTNAVKFTHRGGKVDIYVSWCPYQQEQAALLAPIVGVGGNLYLKRRDISPHKRLERSPKNSLIEVDGLSRIEEMNPLETESFIKKLSSVSGYQIKRSKLREGANPDLSPQQGRIDNWSIRRTQFPNHKLFNQRLNNSGATDFSRQLSNGRGFLKVEVLDTGCGITEKDFPKLFGMFEQSTQHARSVQGGTGLGLWICKQICQKMNGDIAVHSQFRKGSSFVFYIPVNNGALSAPELKSPIRSQNKIKALVVDDYQTNRYMHKLLLEQQGVHVTTASNGQEAVEKYQTQVNNPYNLILMDVHMPIMDGFTAAKIIRGWEIETKRKPTAIYFVTGEYFNEEDVLMRFRSVGGSSHGMRCLKKPLDGDILKKLIDELR